MTAPKTSASVKVRQGKQPQKKSPLWFERSRWVIGLEHFGQRGDRTISQLLPARNQFVSGHEVQTQEWPPSLRRTGRMIELQEGHFSSWIKAPFCVWEVNPQICFSLPS